jgi:hypothetical protein
VDAFNRWSFVNRGDLDGQWQLVRSFDVAKKRYYREVTPEPVAYYGYGIITRFLSKYSSRLKDEVLEAGATTGKLLTVTMQSPAGNLTTYLLNLGTSPVQTVVRYEGLTKGLELNVYQATEAGVSKPGFRMDPLRQIKVEPQNPGFTESLPARSVTVMTTFKLKHSDNGIGSDPP